MWHVHNPLPLLFSLLSENSATFSLRKRVREVPSRQRGGIFNRKHPASPLGKKTLHCSLSRVHRKTVDGITGRKKAPSWGKIFSQLGKCFFLTGNPYFRVFTFCGVSSPFFRRYDAGTGKENILQNPNDCVFCLREWNVGKSAADNISATTANSQ